MCPVATPMVLLANGLGLFESQLCDHFYRLLDSSLLQVKGQRFSAQTLSHFSAELEIILDFSLSKVLVLSSVDHNRSEVKGN